MKWKVGVSVDCTDGCWITYRNLRRSVPEEDLLIVDLMGKGISDDEALLDLVAESSQGDRLLAGFRLAQFVEDFGYFLAEGVKSSVIDS